MDNGLHSRKLKQALISLIGGIFPRLLQIYHNVSLRAHTGNYACKYLFFIYIGSMSPSTPVSTSLAEIQYRIAQTCASMVAPASALPTLIAASKSQSAASIEALIAQGIYHFGENRVQEAQAKWPDIKMRHPQITLHLIGPMQSNKVADAVALCDVIETIDRKKIADAVAAEAKKQGKHPICLIQVNIGDEPQKSGVSLAEVDSFIPYCLDVAQLRVEGLMCVPPADKHPAPYFALLRQIALRHGLTTLSMGMSSDYETAIRMGATHIRIGTALFGQRA